MSKIVGKGKYTGRPLTDLLADKGYCKWLQLQVWFPRANGEWADIRQAILKEISNDEHHPKATPEHNKFQLRFLDDEFTKRFIMSVLPTSIRKTLPLETFKELPGFDISDGFVKFTGTIKYCGYEQCRECKECDDGRCRARDRDRKCHTCLKDPPIKISLREQLTFTHKLKVEQISDIYIAVNYHAAGLIGTIKPDHRNYDLGDEEFHRCDFYPYVASNGELNLFIELKPLVGEDYPDVLRQILNQRRVRTKALENEGRLRYTTDYWILFIDEFKAETTTPEQLCKYFALQNIEVVFLKDLKL